MTKIYCLKCKAYIDTTNEDRDISSNGRYWLSGICTKCENVKCVFTDENYSFATHKKTAKEIASDKIKNKERALNRRAKKLGRAILDSDKKVQKCVKKCLKEA